MPFTHAGARRMLEGLVSECMYAHVHTEIPPTGENTPKIEGYRGYEYKGRWEIIFFENKMRVENADSIYFPTTEKGWDKVIIESIGMWNRMDLLPNEEDPPGFLIINPFSFPKLTGRGITIPKGSFYREIINLSPSIPKEELPSSYIIE